VKKNSRINPNGVVSFDMEMKYNCEKIKEMSNILSGFVKDFQLPHDFCCQ